MTTAAHRQYICLYCHLRKMCSEMSPTPVRERCVRLPVSGAPVPTSPDNASDMLYETLFWDASAAF
eukprot:3062279-Pyramimonas_sp.AAC.1